MIQWEECSLDVATHVEIGGKVHEIKKHGIVERNISCDWIDILIDVDVKEYAQIPQEAFILLGIKCLRKFKPTPIEFIYTVGGGIAPPNEAYGKTFLCVEIEKEKE